MTSFRKAAAIAAALLLSPLAAQAQESTAESTTTEPAVEQSAKFEFPELLTAPVVGQDEIRSMVKTHGSDLLVVNFWATWCIPCIEELPYFEETARDFTPERVRVVGVSVDLKAQVETAVIPFLKRRNLNYPTVVYFGDQQQMIEFFSDAWEGDIPATFLFDKKGNKVAELIGKVSREQLRATIEKHLPPEKPAEESTTGS